MSVIVQAILKAFLRAWASEVVASVLGKLGRWRALGCMVLGHRWDNYECKRCGLVACGKHDAGFCMTCDHRTIRADDRWTALCRPCGGKRRRTVIRDTP